MTALTLHPAFGTPVVFVKPLRSSKERAEAAATKAAIRNMALFLVSPFIGLLYAILLPFVGLAMLAWFAARAFIESGAALRALRVAKKALLIAVAPFLGLAYMIALPFAGLAMLAWFGAGTIMAAPAK
jgi:hypothetical protein